MSVPYLDYCISFRDFLTKNGWPGPREFWKDVSLEMRAAGSDGFSEAAAWAAFYGWKKLPDNADAFCRKRHGFGPDWKSYESRRNYQGIKTKTNQMVLPGMRELKESRRLRR